jgi:hypothetical protein
MMMAVTIASIEVLQGCGGAVVATNSPPPVVTPADVYVAGYEMNASNVKVAMVWKNGVGTALSDGIRGAYASAVAVSGTDVYVAGVVAASVTNSDGIATVWKNGNTTSLTDGTVSAYASGIAVSGTDVYVSGGEYGPNAQNLDVDIGGYWKNGVFNLLTQENHQDGSGQANISAITLNGSDVYVAGTEGILTPGVSSNYLLGSAIYWKNGNPTILTNGLTSAAAESIVVDGSDVYVAGALCPTLYTACYNSVYWKDGSLVSLDLTTPSILSGIAVSNGVVYASTNQDSASGNNLAEYWDGTTEKLLDNSTAAAANGIAVLGTDVYVVGAQIGGACYWKNGILHSVTGGEYASTGYAITVVQP